MQSIIYIYYCSRLLVMKWSPQFEIAIEHLHTCTNNVLITSHYILLQKERIIFKFKQINYLNKTLNVNRFCHLFLIFDCLIFFQIIIIENILIILIKSLTLILKIHNIPIIAIQLQSNIYISFRYES